MSQSYLNGYKWSEEGDFEPKSLDRMQMVRRRKFSAENLFCRRACAFFAETRLKWVLAFRSVLIRTFSKKCNISIYIYIFIIFLSKVSSSGAFFVTGSYQGGVIWEWEVMVIGHPFSLASPSLLRVGRTLRSRVREQVETMIHFHPPYQDHVHVESIASEMQRFEEVEFRDSARESILNTRY